MAHLGALNMQIATTVGAMMMALLVIFVRLRASARPTTARKIMIPPIAMSTGFLMFLSPQTHIPLLWALVAFLTGVVLFSYPLIKTSKFHIVDGKVYLKRSKSFIFILLGLLVLRMLLHGYVEHYVSIPQTGAIFFILAFGMILPWRLAMLYQYLKLQSVKD
ncbi:CcdC family protein [Ferviditalea candida]|uniref:Cytochrome c biogenesis protein CcdC n=1 Tax=Ferviditalea candida TaxID=3108399 RepID=A0ABU5ZFS3_9BACL|nr:cytochrome c biogenesis protein CcdC [Paenibacillaceae bacterium T2]